MYSDLARLTTFLVDLDGVVYRGKTLLPGVEQFFQFLSAHDYSYTLLTNNSTRTAAQVAQRLGEMGINVSESAVFTSGEALASYLSKSAPKGASVFIIGENGLREPVLQAGFKIEDRSPDYVLVGLDRNFNYDAMAKACVAIRAGARFIATNPDTTYPVEHRLILPGAGALVASIVACTNTRPVIIGKPNKLMLLLAMQRLGAKKSQTVIIGDRLDTDILAGRRAGICTILVLTGVTSQEDVNRSRIKPDYVFRDLEQLRAALEQSEVANHSTGQ